jgi:hypothetical protein
MTYPGDGQYDIYEVPGEESGTGSGSGNSPNLDGGMPDTEYGGVTAIDAGGV